LLALLIGLALPMLSSAQEALDCTTPDPTPARYAQMREEVHAILSNAKLKSNNQENTTEIPLYFTVIRDADGHIQGPLPHTKAAC